MLNICTYILALTRFANQHTTYVHTVAIYVCSYMYVSGYLHMYVLRSYIHIYICRYVCNYVYTYNLFLKCYFYTTYIATPSSIWPMATGVSPGKISMWIIICNIICNIYVPMYIIVLGNLWINLDDYVSLINFTSCHVRFC